MKTKERGKPLTDEDVKELSPVGRIILYVAMSGVYVGFFVVMYHIAT